MKKVIAIVAAIFIAVSAFAGTGITGFLPQKTGYKKNFTPNQIADYAFDGAKPNIVPSNKFWTNNYTDYAVELKGQIILWMAAESGNADITEEEAEEMFRNLPTRKTVGKVKATGLSINQGTGEILGLAEPIERDPYETVDGKGEYEIYGQTGSMSCVCANTHIGIEASQDEWEDEAVSTTTKKSNSYKIPSGTNLTINITNTANGGAGGTATATATNTPSKSTGNWDSNDDPPAIIKKNPKVIVVEEEDDYTTTVVKKKPNCYDCETTTNSKYDKQMLRNARATTAGTYLMPLASSVLGAFLNSRWQKQPVNNSYFNNYYNLPDDTGDGGNLPDDDTGDGGDLPGDGGNLPGFQRTSNQNGFRLK